jgi:hypothetical protein
MKGPSLGFTDNFPKRQMWTEIAKELNGEYKIKQTSGNVIEIHNLSLQFKKWKIKISVSDSRPLKFNVVFTPITDFELVISREDFIEKILKKIGKSEIELGWKEFDDHYLIHSNRSDLAKQILTSEFQKTILKYDVNSISIQTNMAKGTAELISVIQRSAGEKEMILELVEAHRLLISNLEKSKIIT